MYATRHVGPSTVWGQHSTRLGQVMMEKYQV
jgi:hypothetical protein